MRAVFLLVVIGLLIHLGSGQTPVVHLQGLTCAQDTLYEIDSVLQCCNEDEIVPVPIADAAECTAYCNTSSLPSIYGRYLDDFYIECVCLTNCNEVSSYSSLFGYVYTSDNIPTSTVQDLASGTTTPNFEINIQPNTITQISLSSTQTATFHTPSDNNGNVLHLLVTVSTTALPADAQLGFTLRNMKSYNTDILQLDYNFVNNSFEVMIGISGYNPPVQYKRQSTGLFSYSMFHQGSGLVVVLSLNGEAIMSWEYSVMISKADNSVSSIANDFVFNLDFAYSTSRYYSACTSNSCVDANVLRICNGSLIEQQYCYLGCNYQTSDCVQCSTDKCLGTCSDSPTPRCLCDEYQIGSDCSFDVSTASVALESYFDINQVTFDFFDCSFGQSCATAYFFKQAASISPDRFCCVNSFTLVSITRMNGTDVLNFSADDEWSCVDDRDRGLPKEIALRWADLAGQVVFNWYGFRGEDFPLYNSTSNDHVVSCDQVGNTNYGILLAMPDVAMPVGVSFLAASCAAVIFGFAVGSVTAPNGMTIKKRGPLARGCIPKYNHDLASSIVVTCVLDVALVTVCSVVGVLYPISMLVLASGVLLVIMTYQIQRASKRFGNIPKRAHHLLTVQKVFGRIAGAFLIVTGLTIFFVGLSALLLGELIIIVAYVGIFLGWILLAVYLTWALVIVHFAAAIYVCVCFYYTAIRTRDQESVRVHTVDMDESSSDYIA